MAAGANLLEVGGVPVDRDVAGARDRGLERLHEVTERELRVAARGARRDGLGDERGEERDVQSRFNFRIGKALD